MRRPTRRRGSFHSMGKWLASLSRVMRTARYLAHNVVFFARLLKEHPIPTNLKELTGAAETVSE